MAKEISMEQVSIKASRAITYPAIIFSLILSGFFLLTGISPYGSAGEIAYAIAASAITIIGSRLIGKRVARLSVSIYSLGALLIVGHSIYLLLTNDTTGSFVECMTGKFQPAQSSCGEILLFFSFTGLPTIILLLFFFISPLYVIRQYLQHHKEIQSK